MANEIANATDGGADGGGNRCARTWSQGGTFWVVAHSMGGPVMDFILGNDDSSEPNFNFNGPYDTVASRVSLAITLSGAHRGSQGADAVCGDSSGGCNGASACLSGEDDGVATTGAMPNALGPVWTDAHTTRAYPPSRFTGDPFGEPGLLEAAERLEGRSPGGS